MIELITRELCAAAGVWMRSRIGRARPDGTVLTPPQLRRLDKSIERLLNSKPVEDVTLPELVGLIEIVQSILPFDLYQGDDLAKILTIEELEANHA